MTFAMIALTGLEEDDWSMEIDSEPMHFGQDGLGDFDWSNTADDTPVSLALMATNSEARTEILGYQMSLESLEVILKTHEKNEYAWGDKYEQMEYDLKMRVSKLEEKQTELDQALRERDDFKDDEETDSSEIQKRKLVFNSEFSETSFAKQVHQIVHNSVGQESGQRGLRETRGKEVLVDTSKTYKTVKESAMIKSNQTWRPKEAYLDSVNRDNGSYTLKQFEYGNPEEDLKDYAIIDSGCFGSMTGDKDKLSDFKEFKGAMGRELKFNLLSVYSIYDKEAQCPLHGPKSCLIFYSLVQQKDEAVLWNRLWGMSTSSKSTSWLKEIWLEVYPFQDFQLVLSCLAHVRIRVRKQVKTKVKTIRCDMEQLNALVPNSFWAEAVNMLVYVLNRVLVTKPQMKTPYEILMGRSPNISFMRPFGCSLTILNTLDHLGKFDGKSEEGYLLGYSTNSKGFRVYNRVTRKVQDCLHVNFLENQENQKGKGPDWMFDLDLLTPSMNYIPVRKENYANSGDKVSTLGDVEDLDDQQFIVHTAQPMHPEERTAAKEVPLSSEEQALHDELMNLMHQESLAKAHNDDQRIAFEEEKRRISIAKGKEHVNSTFTLSTANTPPQSAGNTPTDSDDDIPKDGVFSTNSFDDENTDTEEGGAADYNKMDPTIDVTSTPTLRIHKIHPQSQIIGKSTAGVQTRRKLKESTSDQHQALLSFIYKQNRTNHKDQQTCLFACFLSQEEPKKVSQALADESWVEAMQEELLQFKLQDVWVLCDLPEGKRVIGTKWVFRNKRDERGTIIKNKARLVAQGYRQEEGVDYDEVFAPVARIEAIRLFLAFASFMGFTVYQMDVKSAFLYGNITEEVYVKQPPGFEDPAHPNKVYRVVKALYGLHQAPRAWYERLSTFLLKHGYRRGAIDKTLFIKKDRRDIMLVQVYVDDIIFGSTKSSMVKDFEELMQKEFKMSSMGELTFFLGLQVKQSNGGIFLSQDKYVKDILNKFDFRTIKPASTPIEAHKSLGKDEEGEDVDVHTYRSMIGCLMYLTASRPDINLLFVCVHDFKSLQRNKSLWLDSSTKQNMLHTSKCCAQVLWMQNQLLDYGFNFMNTEIHIDNESTICIVRNPVFHSKTKHIQIRHHFIRDCYEQRLINVVKVHTDDNVADLLTKGFDLARFNFLVVTIGMMNP
ncbi:putative ribonuclease H-like domain-containing protein [Tanacetum coccineum]